MKRLLRVIRRLFMVGLTLAALTVLSGFIYETVMRATNHRAFPPPGRLVDVGGHTLHLHCVGAGSPTVLLEAGQDARGSLSWTPIKESIAAVTRVCAYDRAGIGWSEAGPNPRISPTIANELDALLTAAEEEGPYVLVGHSMAGIHIRNFADLDRSAVAGLVFVDASHPEQVSRLPAEITGLPPAPLQMAVKFVNRVGLFRFVSLWPDTPMSAEVNAVLRRFRPSSNVGLWAEATESARSFESAIQSPGFGDLPLMVLTAGQKPSFAPQELFDRSQPVRLELHEELAALSTSGSHQVIHDATHYIHVDRADVVIAAITEVVEAARTRAAHDRE